MSHYANLSGALSKAKKERTWPSHNPEFVAHSQATARDAGDFLGNVWTLYHMLVAEDQPRGARRVKKVAQDLREAVSEIEAIDYLYRQNTYTDR